MRKINTDYLDRIRRLVNIYSKRRTSNILEGNFPSIFRGRSMDFDDLDDYHEGDDVHDIDWKSSSRAGKLLIRRYMSEKKFNIIFVCDSGLKMDADTSKNNPKDRLATTLLGACAYIVDKQGGDYAFAVSRPEKDYISLFKSGPLHMNSVITDYENTVRQEPKSKINTLLEIVADSVKRKKLIILITDLDGIRRIDEKLLRKLKVSNEMITFCIDDQYLTGNDAFDVEKKRYEVSFVTRSRKLKKYEHEERELLWNEKARLFAKYNMTLVRAKSEAKAIDKIIEAFGRHRTHDYGVRSKNKRK